MKNIPLILFTIVLLFVVPAGVFAQKDKLIILVRHGEKAVLESADMPDPELSEAGKARAVRLRRTIGKYRPGAFYSTNYRRTRDTITPLAKKRRKTIQIYDARDPQKLIDEIMASKTKRFVVAGHSNTVPGLANLLIKKELFKNLQESEFSTIWLIRIEDGKVKEVELLDY